MTKSMEERLREISRSQASAAHQARMRELFDEAQRRRPALWRRPIAAWQAMVIAATCAVLGFLSSAYLDDQEPSETVRTTVYVLEGSGDTFRRAFDLTQGKQQAYPDEVWASFTAPLPRSDGSI